MPKQAPAKASFIEPMYAAAVQRLPEGPEWLYEIKFDGYRCINNTETIQGYRHRGQVFC